MGQMSEIAIDHPAVIDDDVAPLRKAFNGKQRAIGEPMLAVLRLSACRYANAVADRERKLRRAVKLEPIRQIRRRRLCRRPQ